MMRKLPEESQRCFTARQGNRKKPFIFYFMPGDLNPFINNEIGHFFHSFKDDYFLYAIMSAKRDPQLYIIRNPAENLNAEEKMEVVRYFVPFNEIKDKGVVKN